MGMLMEGHHNRTTLLLWSMFLALIFASSCALVKPTRHYEESTPIDQGLAGTYLSTAVVMPLEAKGNESWGAYAAQRLTEYLIEQKAYRQVVYTKDKVPGGAGYIITGTLDHLSYGGNEAATTVFLTIKVLGAADSQTLFYRTAKASSKMSAFHMTRLQSVDVPSPYIEEVLNSMLERIAKDIASRTNLPAVQNP
jgi:hypothetical protein